MPAVQIKAKNLETWKREADRFVNTMSYDAIKDSSQAIAALYRKSERQLFASQGGSGKHGSWPPLSKKYREWKEKKFPGRTIMILRGRLVDSLTRQATGTVNFVSRAGRNYTITMGTDVKSKGGFDYPEFHQENRNKTRRTIDPTDVEMDKWANILQRGVIIQARKYQTLWGSATASRPARMDRREV